MKCVQKGEARLSTVQNNLNKKALWTQPHKWVKNILRHIWKASVSCGSDCKSGREPFSRMQVHCWRLLWPSCTGIVRYVFFLISGLFTEQDSKRATKNSVTSYRTVEIEPQRTCLVPLVPRPWPPSRGTAASGCSGDGPSSRCPCVRLGRVERRMRAPSTQR